jgi:epoxyqueuosine reductase
VTNRLTDRVLDAGRAAGLVAVGVTTAEPFDDVRAILERRKAEGLSADMQFTYRNPARSTTPADALAGARSLVVCAWPTANIADDDGPNRGRLGRYVWRDYYAELRDALERVAEVLRNDGHKARVVVDDNALVDRAAAYRAGLGWFGKNANVLVPGHGSWVVLGSVLTTASLDANETPVADGCGGCTRCVDGCPTGAIVAPGVVDARRCLAWLVQSPGDFPLEFRAALGDRIYGCDDCQEVCPPSRVVTRRAPEGEPTSVDLVALANATDDEILADHGTWYIAKRDPRYVRRNALVALGNSGDPADELVVRTVRNYVDSDDELLAEHAQWALDRLAGRSA